MQCVSYKYGHYGSVPRAPNFHASAYFAAVVLKMRRNRGALFQPRYTKERQFIVGIVFIKSE